MRRWWRSWTGRALVLALVVGALAALPMMAQAVEVPDIVGQVSVMGSGEPVANWNVYAIDDNYEFAGDTYTDASGNYALTGLGDGAYMVYTAGGWSGSRYFNPGQTGDWLTVDGSTRPVTANLGLEEVLPSITGKVTDASTGDPLQYVAVDAYRDDGMSSYYYAEGTYVQEDGTYGFFFLPQNSYKLAFYDYEFELTEWWDNAASMSEATPILVTSGTTQIADAAIDRPAPSLAGHVTDEVTGLPIPDVYVGIEYWNGEWWDYYRDAWTDNSGEWKVFGLPAGAYRVHYYVWYGEAAYASEYQDVDLPEGGSLTDVDAALTPLPAATPDAFEPDDTMFEAPLVDPDGGTGLHSIYPEGDTDWVKFPVRAGRIYSAKLRGLAYGWFDAEVSFVDGDGSVVSWNNTYSPAEDGYLYLHVEPYGFDGGNCWYELSLTEEIAASLSGTVRADDSGDPLEGIRAVLLKQSDYDGEEGWWDWWETEYTDASGQYSFPALSASAGPFRLEFDAYRLPDYVSEYFDDTRRFDDASDIALTAGEEYIADASLARAGKIAGTVTDEDSGQPLRNIEVVAVPAVQLSGYHSSWAETDSSGQYEFGGLDPSISYNVRFYDYMSSYATEWYDNVATQSEARDIVLTAGRTETADAALSLIPGVGHIRGRVEDRETGLPLQGIRVTYVSGTEGTSSYSSGYLDWTDASGEYRAGGFDASKTYKIRFSDSQSGYTEQYFNDKPDAASADPVSLTPGAWFTANASLDLDPTKATLSGVVRADDTGEVMTRGYVAALTHNVHGMSDYWSWEREAEVEDDGSYRIRGLEPGTEYIIWAWGQPDYQTSSYLGEYYNNKRSRDAADRVTFSAGDRANIDFSLTAAAHLSGTVTEEGTGRPAKGVQVQVYEPRYLSGYQVSGYSYVDGTRVDAAGRYELWDLDPTTPYRLAFVDDEKFIWQTEFYDNKTNFDEADDLRLSVGDNVVDAQLARNASIGALSGRVTDAYTHEGAPFVQVDLFYIDSASGYSSGYWGRAHTLADGSFAFDSLPKWQTYKLKFSDPYGGPRYADEYYNGKPDFDSADTIAFDESTSDIVADAALVPLAGDTVLPTLSDDAESSYDDSATVNLSATDGESGLKALYYTVDGSDVVADEDGSAAVRVTGLGNHEIVYWAEDNSDNRAADRILNFTIVDATKPTASASVAPAANADGWRRAPATVTLSGDDVGSGLAGVNYRIGAGADTTYTVPFAVAEGTVDVTYRAVDNAGNRSDAQVLTVKSDGTAPSVPSGLTYSALTTSTVTLSWSGSSDAGSGVGAYAVYKDGTLAQTVTTGTSVKLTGLTPGSSVDFQVLAIDKVGNESALSAVKTVTMPDVDGSAQVPGTGAQQADIDVDGFAVHVEFENVTQPGVITVTMTGNPPADADSGYRFMGLHFDIDFSGQIAPGSSISFTLPYDPAIPDARARSLKIKHWKNNGWETITPTSVDTANHTVTFTVDSLSPFVLAEASSVDVSTTFLAGFGSATDTRSEITVGYGKGATLVGKLKDATGNGLSRKTVVAERYDTALRSWVTLGYASAGTTAGEYRYTVKPHLGTLTSFRMNFVQDDYNTASQSTLRALRPNTWVSTPVAPSRMSRTKYYTAYGYLKPKHASVVRIYKWRKTSTGKWRSYGYVTAKTSALSDKTKYSVRLKLGRAGTWKLRAYTPKDTGHAATWSSGYDYVRVR